MRRFIPTCNSSAARYDRCFERAIVVPLHFVQHSGGTMKRAIALIAVALSLTACGSMDTRDRNTGIGAGLGAAAGAAVTDGSVAGTVGGAAVGGVIGNQVR
jgi:osmotically inducible lipoprotein OsmB